MRRILSFIAAIFVFATLFAGSADNKFYFFYSKSCPHCHEAKPFIEELKNKYPQIQFEMLEITDYPDNRQLFQKKCEELNITSRGVPTFILGSKSTVGYKAGVHDKLIINMLDSFTADGGDKQCSDQEKSIEIPLIGKIDPHLVNLPTFTLIIGLLDGINPCAMWVLMFLLTLLVSAKDRKKLIMVGTVFVASSGVVYFLFMTAWLNIFLFIGIKEYVTIALGVLAVVMGAINVKEFFWFKKGVSLMIPEGAKPKLFQKMRKIINNTSVFWSFIGTVTLAFFVNLIELGCTIGFPAIYTRVISIQNIGTLPKYLYMALYNVYYIVPLAIIVGLFVFTMGKYRFEEKHAKILKLVSGILMLALGIILVIKPDLMVFS